MPSAKYRPTRLVVDAALRRIGKSRHGGHKIANISRNFFVNRFKNGFHQWIQRIFLVVVEAIFSDFFCFQNLDALHRPVAGKPLVLGDLCLDMGTSVASALTAETIFEIIKCTADHHVDMRGRVRMGSKSAIFRFFNSGYAHDRNISIFRHRAFLPTQSTLIKLNYASVRQSRDSLDRDRHNVTKKSRRRRALKPLELKSSKNSRRRVL